MYLLKQVEHSTWAPAPEALLFLKLHKQTAFPDVHLGTTQGVIPHSFNHCFLGAGNAEGWLTGS